MQIGEPRLDSGLELPEQTSRPPFDPLAPLLPEELCWMFDTALAYQVRGQPHAPRSHLMATSQVEWMLGSPLAHTVFTFLYTHALEVLNPDFLPYDALQEDPARPLSLVTIVLRAYVMGLLKCCGIAWTQLSTSLQEDVRMMHIYVLCDLIFSPDGGLAKRQMRSIAFRSHPTALHPQTARQRAALAMEH